MIYSIFFTGSFLLPAGKEIIETNCFYNEKCFVIIKDVVPIDNSYYPIVINFLVYDIRYIIAFIGFIIIGYIAYCDVRDNYF